MPWFSWIVAWSRHPDAPERMLDSAVKRLAWLGRYQSTPMSELVELDTVFLIRYLNEIAAILEKESRKK